MRLLDPESERACQPPRRAGGIVLRVLCVMAVGTVAWCWTHTATTRHPAPRPASPALPTPSANGTLIFPATARSGGRSEPMVLVPVSAKVALAAPAPTVAPAPASAAKVAARTPEPVPAPASAAADPDPPGAPSTKPPQPASARGPFDEKVLALQVALTRQGISSGSLDGVMGSQTRAALRAFQRQAGLAPTGEPDATTLSQLELDAPLYLDYNVSAEDLAGLQPVGKTWLAKSQQTSLAHETLLERIAELSHSNPKLVRWLNPAVNWEHVAPGLALKLVDAGYPEPETKAAFLRIALAERKLQAFDSQSNLLVHFPCSIAARVDKRPLGEELHIAAIAPHPNYTFDPAVFPESAEARELGRKLILQPGPNNPVGTLWLSLDKPGYGIHGTPKPEDVGRTESHGCFRLANWNAEYLLKLVSIGTPVFVDP